MGGRGSYSASSKKTYKAILRLEKVENLAYNKRKNKKKEKIKKIRAPKGYKTKDYEQNIRYFEKVGNQFKGINKGKPNSVYVSMSKEKVKSIIYFDKKGNVRKQIDFKPPHNGLSPHVHLGNVHDKNSPYRRLNDKEKRMVERVNKKWYNTYHGK